MKRVWRIGGVVVAAVAALSLWGCGGGGAPSNPATTSSTTGAPPMSTLASSLSPSPTRTTPPPTKPPQATPGVLSYPYDGKNMFFGLSLINARRDAGYVQEVGASWLSLQPHVIWFSIESAPGVYDWSSVDVEVKQLQEIGLDITMVLSPVMNAFGDERKQIAAMASKYSGLLEFLRESDAAKQYKLYPHDELIPVWISFLKAAVDRYDGNGQNDMPGLKSAVRNWHFVEEYPCPEIKDPRVYADLLKTTYETIKGADPKAKVIMAGLAGNFLRYFAFMDGLITDEDAGVIDSVMHPRAWWNANPVWKTAKTGFEGVLEACKDYFDIMDIHTYIIKENFMEPELAYIKQAMQRYGYSKPIWIIEGGGPFKNYPGKKAVNSPGDPYFGMGSEKENGEFVVKLLAMAAAAGVERQHWGLGLENSDDGYWDGPWKGMSLMDPDEHYKKPSYFNYKMMREKVADFTSCRDLSQGASRVFAFSTPRGDVYIAWNPATDTTVDLSAGFGSGNVKVTPVVTELDAQRNPVYPAVRTVSARAVPLTITPVFVEKLQ